MNSNYLNAIRLVDISTALLLGVVWFGIVLFLRLKKKKEFVYLFFFTLFYAYIVKVLDYTLFQFQSLLLLKYFVPGLLLQGIGKSINLIPLITLTPEDVKTSLLNILLMIPFGFGLPFITNLHMKNVVVVGALFSIAIELLQFFTGFVAHITFRVADINDVIFNTAGVVIGYVLFVGFVRVYRRMLRDRQKAGMNPMLQYIVERPQIAVPQ